METLYVRGPECGGELELEGGYVLVGRVDAPGVFRGDPTLSREHALVVATEFGVRLKDLGSQNGVWVEGRRLGRYEEVSLAPGGEFVVGGTRVRLLGEEEREALKRGEAPALAPVEERVEGQPEVEEAPATVILEDEVSGGEGSGEELEALGIEEEELEALEELEEVEDVEDGELEEDVET